jgi:steroid 5-alpha reductase family enzyme
MKTQFKAAISLVVVAVLASLFTLALANGSVLITDGIPAAVLVIGFVFLVQWVAFIPAYFLRTESFFDLTGSLTYIISVVGALLLVGRFDLRSLIVVVLVVIWAARLGSFLFKRIKRDGKDGRFDEIKQSSIRFFNVWTIQGLWVSLTAGAAYAVIFSAEVVNFDPFLILGSVIWLLGFAVEVIADQQKSEFRSQAQNKGKFISTGLWAYSRHPNYVGEILLWTGIAIIAFPSLSGWSWIALISPVFVYLLLSKVSGVPMLEARADERWGNNDEYQKYKVVTPVLWPRLRS